MPLPVCRDLVGMLAQVGEPVEVAGRKACGLVRVNGDPQFEEEYGAAVVGKYVVVTLKSHEAIKIDAALVVRGKTYTIRRALEMGTGAWTKVHGVE